MSDKSSEKSEMSDVASAALLIKQVAPNRGGVGARILAASRLLGWRYSRARDVWYEQARRIDAREMDQLREAREARETREASDEYRALRARIARIEAALRAQDEAFHRPQIDALEQLVGGLRRQNLSRDRGGGR